MPLSHASEGVYAIAPTPFHADGRVDEASLDRMTDFYVEAGCTGITVLGIMGEAPKLEAQEGLSIATRMIRRAKSLPVVVGVSSPGFAAMRALARQAMTEGAAGVMIAPPPTCAPTIRSSGIFGRPSRRSDRMCPGFCRTIH